MLGPKNGKPYGDGEGMSCSLSMQMSRGEADEGLNVAPDSRAPGRVVMEWDAQRPVCFLWPHCRVSEGKPRQDQSYSTLRKHSTALRLNMHACSVVSVCDPIVAPPAPLSMGFSTQEYWSGLSISCHVTVTFN